jgi:hypothetical protein
MSLLLRVRVSKRYRRSLNAAGFVVVSTLTSSKFQQSSLKKATHSSSVISPDQLSKNSRKHFCDIFLSIAPKLYSRLLFLKLL